MMLRISSPPSSRSDSLFAKHGTPNGFQHVLRPVRIGPDFLQEPPYRAVCLGVRPWRTIGSFCHGLFGYLLSYQRLLCCLLLCHLRAPIGDVSTSDIVIGSRLLANWLHLIAMMASNRFLTAITPAAWRMSWPISVVAPTNGCYPAWPSPRAKTA